MELTTTQHKILRLPQVCEKTGLSRATIYLRVKEGNFPNNIHLGKRSVGWLESEIELWIHGKITESRNCN